MFVLFLAGISACNRKGHRVLEVNYVSAQQAALRDQVATIFNRVGTVKNGERVEVLERDKRFSRVRTAAGTEGWIEQRYLVDQTTYYAGAWFKYGFHEDAFTSALDLCRVLTGERLWS